MIPKAICNSIFPFSSGSTHHPPHETETRKAMVGNVVIMLILAFDRPLHGDLGIDPAPYQLVREQLMNQ